ncbi:unnamed protein product [Mytilus edulis]|uniref:Uncharacterized protein n=1 Tax=Mytilus edulis TaxID=6550 RepID=A0A8S3RZN4_MYTED|nr:unnamed protein product [Mytilus edulis]
MVLTEEDKKNHREVTQCCLCNAVLGEESQKHGDLVASMMSKSSTTQTQTRVFLYYFWKRQPHSYPVQPLLQLKKSKTYEIALVNLEIYYSIPNIHVGNNSFWYSTAEGTHWFFIVLRTGSYGIDEINDEVQRQLRLNKHKAEIIIDANRSILRATSTLSKNYQVDFNVVNSTNTVLGFKRQLYTFDRATNGYTEGEYIVSITSINSILVNCGNINGSYVNSTQQSTVYSFSPAVDPGVKIMQTPKNLVYLPVTLRTINRMQTYLTDQDGDPINLRGEHLTIRFHLREV